MGEVVLVRHGETEWSRAGQHTGLSDIPLTPTGEEQARALRSVLSSRTFALVLTSPLQRAARTAELAGLPAPLPEPDLREWDYGSYDGRTTADIGKEQPGWTIWDGGTPDGETAAEVGARADRVLDRVRTQLAEADASADVALVGHGHALRVLAARWLDLAAPCGRLFRLDTATVSVLSEEHSRPVIRRWNLTPGNPPA